MTSPALEEEPLSKYHGKNQPPINQRLQQIYNFLADEDIYRCFNFTGRLREVREYIQDLQTGAQKDEKYDRDLLASINAQIEVHERWNKESMKTAEFEFSSPTLEHIPRLMPRNWKPKRPLIDLELENLAKLGKPDSPVEAKIHLSLQEVTGKKLDDEPDPFEFTKLVSQYRQQQEAKAEDVRKQYEQGEALAFNPLPASFKGPWIPPSPEALVKQWRTAQQALDKLFDDLVEAGGDAPRSPLTEIVNIINTNVRGANTAPRSEFVKATDFSSEEFSYLSILAQKSTVHTLTPQLDGSQATFCDRVEGLMDDHAFWPRGVDTLMSTDDVFERVEGMGNLGLQYEERVRLLHVMEGDGRIRFQNFVIQRPLPTSHPEDGLHDTIPPSYWTTFAERAVVCFLRLTYHLDHHKDEGYMKKAIVEHTNDVLQRVRSWEADVDNATSGTPPSLLDLARRVADAKGLKGVKDEAMAVKILQGQIAEESNNNWEIRATPETIWGWAGDRSYNIGERFSVKKWSPTIQLADYHQKHAEWVLRRRRHLQELRRKTSPRNVRDLADKVVSRSSRETQHIEAGSSFLPFGETLAQEVVISRRIMRFLRDEKVKTFEWIEAAEKEEEDASSTKVTESASTKTSPAKTSPTTQKTTPDDTLEKQDDETKQDVDMKDV